MSIKILSESDERIKSNMEFVSLQNESHIGIVTLNRPPANAMSRQLYKEITDTFRTINTMDDIWVVVLTSAQKQFSTGHDVEEFISGKPSEVQSYCKTVEEWIASVYGCRVPVIAAINGYALGVGMALATCCDILIAADNAYFGIPEVKVGMVGASCFTSRVLPEHISRYLAFTGDPISAAQMKHFGAVWEVVPVDQLHDTAMKIAGKLAQLPPLALRGFKKVMAMHENAQLREKYGQVEVCFIKEMLGTEDSKEAAKAFMEKRKPNYKCK
jgi:enoyl-CoA hydratase